jgi:cysteinyl-tRNA synthetase
LRQLIDRGFTGDDYRYWLLTSHYRSPINFSWEALQGAKQALYRLKRYMYEDYKQIASKPSVDYIKGFKALLANDLDTPSAIALIWQLIKDDSIDNKTKCATLLIMDSVLDIGLSEDLEEGAKTLGIVSQDEVPNDVQELIGRVKLRALPEIGWRRILCVMLLP